MRSHLSAASLCALAACSSAPAAPPPPTVPPAPQAPSAPAPTAAPSSAPPARSASNAPRGPDPGMPMARVDKPFSAVLRMRPSQQVRVAQTTPPTLVVEQEGAPPRFFAVDGASVSERKGPSASWPGSIPSVGASFAGDPRGHLWAVVQQASDSGQSYWVLESSAGGWKQQEARFPEGGYVLPGLIGPHLLLVNHGDAGRAPAFSVLASSGAAERPPTPPKMTLTPRHPKKCISQITTVHAFRAFDPGELIVVGASCWIPTLQIERWGKGQKKADAREIASITLQDISQVTIPGPDEIDLKYVVLDTSTMALEDVALRLEKGVWKIKNRKISAAREEADPSGLNEALRAMNLAYAGAMSMGDLQFIYAHYPAAGASSETLLLRRGEGPELDLR